VTSLLDLPPYISGIVLQLGPATMVWVKINHFLERTLLNPDHSARAVLEAVTPVDPKGQTERSFLIANMQ